MTFRTGITPFFTRHPPLAISLLLALFMTACAGPAPNYSPSIDNVEGLKKSGAAAVKVGAFAVAANLPGGKAISLRANSMVSPVGTHFGDYLAQALRQELELAKLYNAQSGVEISGALLRNQVDAGGVSNSSGQMEARFVVQRGGQIRFDKIKRVAHQWESAFAGAVAIPLAASNYSLMVQKLIGNLVSDPEFIEAIRN